MRKARDAGSTLGLAIRIDGVSGVPWEVVSGLVTARRGVCDRGGVVGVVVATLETEVGSPRVVWRGKVGLRWRVSHVLPGDAGFGRRALRALSQGLAAR